MKKIYLVLIVLLVWHRYTSCVQYITFSREGWPLVWQLWRIWIRGRISDISQFSWRLTVKKLSFSDEKSLNIDYIWHITSIYIDWLPSQKYYLIKRSKFVRAWLPLSEPWTKSVYLLYKHWSKPVNSAVAQLAKAHSNNSCHANF